MAKHTIRNTQTGMRGVNAVQGFVDIAPGQKVEGVELDDSELESAKATGYFEFGDAVETAAGNSDADGLPETKAELEKLAKAEGIDLDTLPGTGANGNILKDDIAGAIKAKRAGIQAPADELDNMDDDTLRTTVQALTGQEAPADADRGALLKLARGQE